MISELVMMVGLMLAPAPASAFDSARPAANIQLAQAAMSPDQAAAMARAQTGGRVLGVDWSDSGGQPMYLVRVLMADGSIRVVHIPATGR